MISRLLIIALATFLTAPMIQFGLASEASAQNILKDSRQGGERQHKRANSKSSKQSNKTVHKQKKTRVEHRSHTQNHARHTAHRHHVTHHRHVTHSHRVTRYGRYGHVWGYRYVHRPRFYTWGSHHHVVHHHHEPRVVIHIEEPEPSLPELECPLRTNMVQTDHQTWCATSRGHKHGPYVRYHSNGDVAEEGWFEYGTREGIWVQYHTNGSLKSEGSYKDNARVGLWSQYNRDGDEISSTHYR